MTATATRLRLSTVDGAEVEIAATHLVVAGYTGRDQDAVRHHIDELAAIGVPEPDTIPAFYPLDVDRLTTSSQVVVAGRSTSGEVEPVLIRANGTYYLTVGSDHTDREIETVGIQLSKAACPKPIASTVIELGDPPAVVDWDAIVVRSWVDGELYQEGTLASMLPITQVLAEWDQVSGSADVALVLFGGTKPLLDGTFRYGREWRMQLEVPGHAPIELTYAVSVTAPVTAPVIDSVRSS
jgi:4-hydroxyphenylacetate 3-monooxygenase